MRIQYEYNENLILQYFHCITDRRKSAPLDALIMKTFRKQVLHILLGHNYRNNGYAVEAVNAYTDYFLNHYNAKRMIATVRDENIPSWKVIEKAGFILSEKECIKI